MRLRCFAGVLLALAPVAALAQTLPQGHDNPTISRMRDRYQREYRQREQRSDPYTYRQNYSSPSLHRSSRSYHPHYGSSHGYYGGYVRPYGYHSHAYYPHRHYGYGSPWDTYYYNSLTNASIYFGPSVLPAELLYGPQALERFLGRSLTAPPATVPRVRVEADEVRRRVPSNAAARERAGRFVEFGDNLFREGEYHAALQRYKSAAEAAPDLSFIHLRQGFALIATSRYDLADDAFRTAMVLDPSPGEPGFRLDHLYGPDAALARTTHLESLAHSALARPGRADLLTLVGVFLYYDGQPDRAERFLRRAMDLDGDDRAFLAGLLFEDDPPLVRRGGDVGL